ncbi:MAG: hypothetical protein K2X66_16185, partial [Cyanobacteria bacterium]|nr:hypothetical protein [Cyanobacteriota bacterium]
SSDVQARIKNEFGELTNCHDPASNGGIGKAVYAAGVDHIGSKLWEILLLKGANSERMGDLIQSMVPKKLEEIQHTTHALANAERKFTNKAANGAALKNFGQEFIKNLAKIGIQKAIGLNDQEKAAWQEYINQNARGIVAFSIYQGASANYWKAQELYSQVFKGKMQALKDASHIPDGVDNRSRFTISPPIKLESGKVLGIKTTPKLPGGMEKLQLGTVPLPENLGHQYSILISAPFIEQYNNGQLGNYGKVNLKFTKVP